MHRSHTVDVPDVSFRAAGVQDEGGRGLVLVPHRQVERALPPGGNCIKIGGSIHMAKISARESSRESA